jgi:hypothetical protein
MQQAHIPHEWHGRALKEHGWSMQVLTPMSHASIINGMT